MNNFLFSIFTFSTHSQRCEPQAEYFSRALLLLDLKCLSVFIFGRFKSLQITLLENAKDFQMNDERKEKALKKESFASLFIFICFDEIFCAASQEGGKWKINIVLSSRSLLEFLRNSAMNAKLFRVVLIELRFWEEGEIDTL